MNRLAFSNIEKKFGKRRILNGVGITLDAGECQLLCGRNGAGKSTLLRILAGMEPPDRAQVTFDAATCRWRRAKKRLLASCIYLHQQPYLFKGSVRYNLGYPLHGAGALRESRIHEGLEWSGLAPLANQAVHQLSGGERQRVALTRAWMRRPQVMLLDEPTANMDPGCRQRTLELLMSLKRAGVTLVVATHDPMHFTRVADRTLDLAGGRLADVAASFDEFPDKVTPINRRARSGL